MNNTPYPKPAPPEHGDQVGWSELQSAMAANEWWMEHYCEKPMSPVGQWLEEYRMEHGSYEMRDRMAEAGIYIDRLLGAHNHNSNNNNRDRVLDDTLAGRAVDFEIIPKVMDLYLADRVLLGKDDFDHTLIPRYFRAMLKVFRDEDDARYQPGPYLTRNLTDQT